MFYGLSRFVKNLLPKDYYRALLIVAIPVVIQL